MQSVCSDCYTETSKLHTSLEKNSFLVILYFYCHNRNLQPAFILMLIIYWVRNKMAPFAVNLVDCYRDMLIC